MSQDTDNMIMRVSSVDGKDSDNVLVRSSQASTTPAHTELIFSRYGQTEFLLKIFESGNSSGVAVYESSKEEKKLLQQSQHPTQHTEGGS